MFIFETSQFCLYIKINTRLDDNSYYTRLDDNSYYTCIIRVKRRKLFYEESHRVFRQATYSTSSARCSSCRIMYKNELYLETFYL